MERFQDKVALVTGANSGIGEQVVRQYLDEGAAVVGLGIGKASLEHEKFIFLDMDITHYSSCELAVNMAVESFGQLDIVVNSAGITLEGNLEETDNRVFDLQMAINVKGTFNVCKAAIGELKKTNGNIVNVASDLGLKTAPHRLVYSATKAAVISMTESIAVDYAPYIRANTVCPGLVDTPMISHRFEQEGEGLRELYNSFYLLNKIAKPKEIADTILFFSSDHASHITGEKMAVNGGGLLK